MCFSLGNVLKITVFYNFLRPKLRIGLKEVVGGLHSGLSASLSRGGGCTSSTNSMSVASSASRASSTRSTISTSCPRGISSTSSTCSITSTTSTTSTSNFRFSDKPVTNPSSPDRPPSL